MKPRPNQELPGWVWLQQGQGPRHAAARGAQDQGRQGDGHFQRQGTPGRGSQAEILPVTKKYLGFLVPFSSGRRITP